MSMFGVNPADERSVQTLVDERMEILHWDSRRKQPAGDPDRREPNALRQAAGRQLVRLGEWISGTRATGMRPLADSR